MDQERNRDILFVNNFLARQEVESLHIPHYGVPYSSFGTDWAGIYLIWDSRGLVYIGQSEDVTRRLHQHCVFRMDIDDLYSNDIRRIRPGCKLAAVPISNPTLRRSIERTLIALLKPLHNK